MSPVGQDIDVVIPYLNQPEHLHNCLRSLTTQAFDQSRVAIVVVDNGSTELPTSILSAFPGVRLIEESVPGPGPARNKGIKATSAPLLAFIDADCIAADGWLQAIADAFRDERTQIVGGDVRIALADPKRMTAIEAYESIYAYRQKQYIRKQGFSGTGNLAMRRNAFDSVGPFAGISVAEDREWGHRATHMGYKIGYVPQMVVFHPARKSMSELMTKWDRQVAHDFREQVQGPLGRVRWVAKAIALEASPVWEAARILRSDRVSTMRARLLAWGTLVRIRHYRALRALRAMFLRNSEIDAQKWNRSG